MRDLLPAEVALRRHLLTNILSVYERFGFEQIETPLIEEIDRLNGSEGGENATLIYKILRRGLDDWPGSEAEAVDLGLRYDLTVPLARFYASHSNELLLPFKSIQTGPVFRAERPQKGRYRQFTQCDIDVIGDASNAVEVELVTATAEALRACEVGDFTIRINDRRLLESMILAAGFSQEQLSPVLIALDKLDKAGAEGVRGDLLKIDDGAATKTLADIVDQLESQETFSSFEDLLPAGTDFAAEGEMRAIQAAIGSSVKTRIDITLVRGMGYYTGSIFEIQHDEFKGSIGGGGRYDRMIGKLSGVEAPAAGFSIGFERLCHILEDKVDIAAGRKKVAFLHGKGEDLAVIGRATASLRAMGDTVRREAAMKNRNAQLTRLTQAGYTHWVELREDVMSEVQPLSPDAKSKEQQ